MNSRLVSRIVVALTCLCVVLAFTINASAVTCGTAWVANHAYTAGTVASYGGHNYSCLQSHTSLVGWEPPNVPALWTDQGVCTTGGATATSTTAPRATATSTTAPRATATATTARATATTARATATATTARATATATATTARATATRTSTATATATTVSGGSVNLSRALYIMPFNNPIPIQTYINETGLKSYMISFILSNGSCTALWDGTQPLNSSTVSSMISTIRSNGGDIAISQGGYAGTKLGQACTDGTAAYNALNAAVTTYSVKAVDFDIEEPEIESINDLSPAAPCSANNNQYAVCKELDAVKLFAQAGKTVSITMPTSATGLNYFGGLTAKAMFAKGICSLSNVHVRVMPFDGGFTQPSGTESAAQALHDQMMTYCGWDSATSWARIGISGMNGRSDTGEFTSLQNWKDIITWVNGKGMPDLTTWAQQRDRPCTPIYGQVDPGTKGDCSSVTDPEGAFGAAMK